MNRYIVLVGVCLMGASCVPTPDYYTVPVQHPPLDTPAEPASGEYVTASQHEADTYFIRDVTSL
ncbi:MAG TPA: hypothetical protein VES20_13845, partial [Bryobacteraceae bacterium]|nr:hypothetical protein [Bryobacteraceae bacterium]